FRSATAAKGYPSLRIMASRPRYGLGMRNKGAMAKSVAAPQNAASMDAVDKLQGAEVALKKEADVEKRKEPEGGKGAAAIEVRKNFAETAFFGPQLKVSSGAAAVDFIAPDQLTSWKVDATVLTADAKFGAYETQTQTRKDLMVRVEMPRF